MGYSAATNVGAIPVIGGDGSQGTVGTPSFLTGDQSSAPFWQDPVGYALFHKSAGPGPSPIEGMAQADWQWYQQNVQPAQQALFQSALSPSTYTKNIQQAQQDVDQQYAGLPNAFKRQLAGMGVTPTGAQTQAFTKQANVNKGLAEAGAMNLARTETTAQNRGILGV